MNIHGYKFNRTLLRLESNIKNSVFLKKNLSNFNFWPEIHFKMINFLKCLRFSKNVKKHKTNN